MIQSCQRAGSVSNNAQVWMDGSQFERDISVLVQLLPTAIDILTLFQATGTPAPGVRVPRSPTSPASLFVVSATRPGRSPAGCSPPGRRSRPPPPGAPAAPLPPPPGCAGSAAPPTAPWVPGRSGAAAAWAAAGSAPGQGHQDKDRTVLLSWRRGCVLN